MRFKNLSTAPFSWFTDGIYAHVQFCSIGRMNKKQNRRFIKPPARVLTPTGIFTGTQPNGDFGTGMKDIGLFGVCGTGHADETIYAISMRDTYGGAPLQTGDVHEWTTAQPVVVREEHLEVESSMYDIYSHPILRYRGSIVRWLEQLVIMLDKNKSPRGPLAGTGSTERLAISGRVDAVAQAAADSASWAREATAGSCRVSLVRRRRRRRRRRRWRRKRRRRRRRRYWSHRGAALGRACERGSGCGPGSSRVSSMEADQRVDIQPPCATVVKQEADEDPPSDVRRGFFVQRAVVNPILVTESTRLATVQALVSVSVPMATSRAASPVASA